MFYSETLLSKTGALARVWLSANLERKLSKKDIRDTNIESSVHAIVGQDQAPLALRLSGQLLLGVVRIYSRKTRYLLDDCNEAINKIKMTFRTGNNDRSAAESHPVNPASLTLQDVMTEIDLNAPFGDPSLLLPGVNLDDSLLSLLPSLQTGSQHLDRSVDGSPAPSNGLMEPGFDTTFGVSSIQGTPSRRGREIEIGRHAMAPASGLAEIEDSTLKFGEGDDIILDIGGDDDMDLPGLNDDTILGMDDDTVQPAAATGKRDDRFQRDSASPLSSLRSSQERELDATVLDDPDHVMADNEEDEVSVHHAQRAKRRKVVMADVDTMIHNTSIQAMQTDHDDILKPSSFLPRDPVLLALIEMQRSGGFVSNILGDGRSKGWAPELRGVLSLEVVRQPLKRKRAQQNTRQDDREASPSSEVPRIEIDLDDTIGLQPGSDGLQNAFDDQSLGLPGVTDGLDVTEHGNNFDETTMPLLHPADSGPVSQGTKHVVHLLRDRFGSEAATSPSKRQQSRALFQDLLPERSTTRADATKMFFEVLVLATKDAIKVDQPVDQLGGPLHVRARRGLWGNWAEMEAGGEIDAQQQQLSDVPASVTV